MYTRALAQEETVRVALVPSVGFATANAVVTPQLRSGQPPPAAMDPDAARMARAKPTHRRELDCLTQAVYFEARGESARGQQAVATVILNRVKNPNFPKTENLAAVVAQLHTVLAETVMTDRVKP